MTNKQDLALAALLRGANREQAAAAAGVNSRTLRNWQRCPEFSGELRRRQTEQVEEAASLGRSRMLDALAVFESVMNDENEAGQTRCLAARNLLQYTLELDERTDVLTRLDALEREMEGSNGNH